MNHERKNTMITNIIKSHSENVSKLDLYNFKNYSKGVVLDNIVNEAGVAILPFPTAWAIVSTHNDQPKPNQSADYEKLVFVSGGTIYHTGSESFKRDFMDMLETFTPADGMDVKCYGMPSKNYSGKNFLCCMPVEHIADIFEEE